MLHPDEFEKIIKLIRFFVMLAIVIYAAKIGRLCALFILSHAD